MNMSIPVPKEVQQEIRTMFSEMCRDVIQEVKEREVVARDWMNVKETEEYLRCSFGTLQKFERMGLKSCKIDGKKLFSKESINNFLKAYEK